MALDAVETFIVYRDRRHIVIAGFTHMFFVHLHEEFVRVPFVRLVFVATGTERLSLALGARRVAERFEIKTRSSVMTVVAFKRVVFGRDLVEDAHEAFRLHEVIAVCQRPTDRRSALADSGIGIAGLEEHAHLGRDQLAS